MGPRKTARDYDRMAMGRSMVNPRTEAAVAAQTGEPLYGQQVSHPQGIMYQPGDPRLMSGQQPPEEMLQRRRQMLAMQLARQPGQSSDIDQLLQQMAQGFQSGAMQGY